MRYLHKAKCEQRWSLWWPALVSYVHIGWSFLTPNILQDPKEDAVSCSSAVPFSPLPPPHLALPSIRSKMVYTLANLADDLVRPRGRETGQAFSRSCAARELWEAKPSQHSPSCSKNEQSSQETECPGRMEIVSLVGLL